MFCLCQVFVQKFSYWWTTDLLTLVRMQFDDFFQKKGRVTKKYQISAKWWRSQLFLSNWFFLAEKRVSKPQVWLFRCAKLVIRIELVGQGLSGWNCYKSSVEFRVGFLWDKKLAPFFSFAEMFWPTGAANILQVAYIVTDNFGTGCVRIFNFFEVPGRLQTMVSIWYTFIIFCFFLTGWLGRSYKLNNCLKSLFFLVPLNLTCSYFVTHNA